MQRTPVAPANVVLSVSEVNKRERDMDKKRTVMNPVSVPFGSAVLTLLASPKSHTLHE